MAESISSSASLPTVPMEGSLRLPKPLPGLALAGLMMVVAEMLHSYRGFATFNPTILALLLGLGFNALIGTPENCRPGTAFAARSLLRLAIALLGLQLALGKLVELGWAGAVIVFAVVPATFLFTLGAGRLLGVPRELRALIAFGTSICGASAVMAGNTVVRGSEDEAAYGVACVTIFGTVAMLVYPLLPALLHLDPHQFGLWTGSSIHEIGQAVAAGFQNGSVGGETATMAKLSRVLLLAPVVLSVGLVIARRARCEADAHHSAFGRVPMPYFIFAFLALAAINSFGFIPLAIQQQAPDVTGFLMTLALAAMGLNTDAGKLLRRGWRPLLLGALASLFICGFSYGLIVALT
ncbi:MAG TPA: putative sulfate exporter family transporter [Terriglobia bacterium]|nr:putative sulfate exporter family transporter [Terriglobia bacterium]